MWICHVWIWTLKWFLFLCCFVGLVKVTVIVFRIYSGHKNRPTRPGVWADTLVWIWRWNGSGTVIESANDLWPSQKDQCLWHIPSWELTYPPKKALLKMIFLFPRWDMLVPWRVIPSYCFIMFHLSFFSICLSLVVSTNGKLVVWVPEVWIPGIPSWKELPRKRVRIRNHQDPSHQFTISLIEGGSKDWFLIFFGRVVKKQRFRSLKRGKY